MNSEMLGRNEENAYFWRMMKIVGHKDTDLREMRGFTHGNMPEPAYPWLLEFMRTRKQTVGHSRLKERG